MNQIDLSIIVASYNTQDLLRSCLSSIYRQTHEITFEVIVIDDRSPDMSAIMVSSEFPQVVLVVNDQNLRYAKTNNKGLNVAKGRYGLLLNSDVEVQSGAFDRLVAFMDNHSEAAAAGPKLVNPDGSTQHCIRSFPSLLPMVFQALNLHKIWPGNPITDKYYNTNFDYDKVQAVQSIGTTAFIIRRSVWETYGLLDERFSLAFVDLAYCYMLGQHKQKIFFFPDSVVMHHGSQSINQSGTKEIRLQHEALREFYNLYYADNHSLLTRRLIHIGIQMRLFLKIVEYHVSRDKRVIKGPGAPKLLRN